MALTDHPLIDTSANNSELSEIKLTSFLNVSTGFILRKEVPDKGCDYDVEIVKDSSKVTNWRFAIQLKSTTNLTTISNEKFISYSFETSRLGYLLRRKPGMGIIIIFDSVSGKIFYDYVDVIYIRLLEDRPSDKWTQNDTVNIRIPFVNELNKKAVQDIHRTFINRFEQADLMYLSQGKKYDLPTISIDNNNKIDFNDLEQIKKALKFVGISLTFRQDIELVYDQLIKLPSSEIIADKELLLISAAVFSEVGKYPDSIFYIERLVKKFPLSPNETTLIIKLNCNNLLNLGRITGKDFLIISKKLLETVQDTLGQIVLKCNIHFYELIQILESDQNLPPESIFQEIMALSDEIENLGIPNVAKGYMKIMNLNNLCTYVTILNKQLIITTLHKTAKGNFHPDVELQTSGKTWVEIRDKFEDMLFSTLELDERDDNRLLYADGLQLLLRSTFELLSIEIFLTLSGGEEVDDKINMLLSKIRMADFAYGVFISHHLFRNAYEVVYYQLELIFILRDVYKFNDEYNVTTLLQTMKKLEMDLEFPQRPFFIPAILIEVYKKEALTMDFAKYLKMDQIADV